MIKDYVSNHDADEVVESLARMDAEEKNKFVRKMVLTWPVLARELTTDLENEMYDTEHYG